MRYFHLNHIKTNVLGALKRFPLFITFCIAGSVLSIISIEFENDFTWETKLNMYHLISILSMGVLLILALSNHAEKTGMGIKKLWITQLLIVVFMLLYYLISPTKFSSFELTMRIVSINLGLSLLVLYLPYHKDGHITAFWQYSKTLFLRLFISYLFTMILFGGLALALFALDVLFGVDVDGELYFYLYIVLVGVFAPLFFAGGLSSDYSLYEKELIYPKALRFLVIYIILPIVSLYMLILYAYAVKIIILWQFPSGWVTNLVLSFSIAGLLSFFLIYPLKDTGNKYISIFFKYYFWLMLPLIALLYVAIFKRIGAYGITELRYYVMILASWLLFLSIYFIFTKHKNLKIIPLSFFIIAVLTSFGPWGAFKVSEKSQLHRFEKILMENDMLKEGLCVKPDTVISAKTQRNISSIVSYIAKYHDVNKLQTYFEADFDTVFTETDRYNKESKILALMGLEYMPYWNMRYDEDEDVHYDYLSFYVDEQENIIDISMHDFLININNYYDSSPYYEKDSIVNKNYKIGAHQIFEEFNIRNNTMSFFLDNRNMNILTIDFNLFIKQLLKEYPNTYYYNLPSEKLRIIKGNELVDIDFQIISISCNQSKEDVFTDFSVSGRLMIKIKAN